ncbi:hypothetical protein A2U01_0026242, partial [Trifolium medium]|nr:hypothetical protein [Trifolium medium]
MRDSTILSLKNTSSDFSLTRQIRHLSPPSYKIVPPRCSHYLTGGAIEALASCHHHLAGVGLLVFSMGFEWFWVLRALFR